MNAGQVVLLLFGITTGVLAVVGLVIVSFMIIRDMKP